MGKHKLNFITGCGKFDVIFPDLQRELEFPFWIRHFADDPIIA